MKKINIILIMIYVIFATSCNDNVIEDIDNNMTEYQKENKSRSNKENIYILEFGISLV